MTHNYICAYVESLAIPATVIRFFKPSIIAARFDTMCKTTPRPCQTFKSHHLLILFPHHRSGHGPQVKILKCRAQPSINQVPSATRQIRHTSVDMGNSYGQIQHPYRILVNLRWAPHIRRVTRDPLWVHPQGPYHGGPLSCRLSGPWCAEILGKARKALSLIRPWITFKPCSTISINNGGGQVVMTRDFSSAKCNEIMVGNHVYQPLI